jgi:plasmid stabilization system protein ParE
VTRYEVLVAARAEAEIRTIDAWWRENRQDAPSLFVEELRGAIERLAATPMLGVAYAAPRPSGVRRLLLRRTRCHVYFTVEDARPLVIVRAVWHASRGRGPRL